MNEKIDNLVCAIKEDQRYINFIEASKLLEREDVHQLLIQYQTVLSKLNELKQFDQYIDNSKIREELKDIKMQMASDDIIQNYYQCYHELNDLLAHVTHIVFNGISDSLDMTGINL